MEIAEFKNVLLFERENIVKQLVKNYEYDYLLHLFNELGESKFYSLVPDNKNIYHFMNGSFEKSKYTKSAISWLPSKELVDGIINLAQCFGIESIDEIYTEMGILSSLLMEKKSKIKITTADTYENINTCEKLNLVPVAKRGAEDYLYYDKIGEKHPEMIISTFYPLNSQLSNPFIQNINHSFLKNLISTIKLAHHKIIIMILPQTYSLHYAHLPHFAINNKYHLFSYQIKAIDKFYSVKKLLGAIYQPMIAHILIRYDLMSDSKYPIEKIFSDAIIPTAYLDTYCPSVKFFVSIYEKLPSKLINNICRIYDFEDTFMKDEVGRISFYMTKYYNIQFPSYIYNISEFLFWCKSIDEKKIYYLFGNRMDFYHFYSTAINIDHDEMQGKWNFPSWIYTQIDKIIFVYLTIIHPKGCNEWKINRSAFESTIRAINQSNQKQILL